MIKYTYAIKYLITSLASRHSTTLNKTYYMVCNSASKEEVKLIKAALS